MVRHHDGQSVASAAATGEVVRDARGGQVIHVLDNGFVLSVLELACSPRQLGRKHPVEAFGTP